MTTRLLLVTPAQRGTHHGNRLSAKRWARMLRSDECRVRVVNDYQGQPCDLLIALHAVRSADSVLRFRAAQVNAPVVVVLTGTDLYGGLKRNGPGLRALDAADRIVALHPLATRSAPAKYRRKITPIIQSATPPSKRARTNPRAFEVAVVGHLRQVKDPFRAAMAARHLPASSALQIVQLGAAMSPSMRERAEREMEIQSRYRWLGDVSPLRAKFWIDRARILVLSSKSEGAANVVSEALACETPIIATRIEGNVGVLGRDYPGYFEVGDTNGLRNLLLRAEDDPAFLSKLQTACASLKPLVDPAREQAAWRRVVRELTEKRR